MNYLVETYDHNERIEYVVFTDRDRALYFAERRRKQGYNATVKIIDIK